MNQQNTLNMAIPTTQPLNNKSQTKKPPYSAIDFQTNDINGKKIRLSHFKKKGVILCFFRGTARPSRNQRILELTRLHKEWSKIGLEVIVVFNQSSSSLRTYFETRPRPFPVIADPKLTLFKKYGVRRVIGKQITAPTLTSPSWINRLFRGSIAWLNPTGRIMPSNFLIDIDNNVVTEWHGNNEHDHIPLEQLETFAIATRVAIRKQEASEH